jgi:hypothetical protein
MSKLIWKLYNENMISEELYINFLTVIITELIIKNTNEYILFTRKPILSCYIFL